jgi:hypothetical protein
VKPLHLIEVQSPTFLQPDEQYALALLFSRRQFPAVTLWRSAAAANAIRFAA